MVYATKVDHYAILEIEVHDHISRVTTATINKAYKRLALIYHPDKRDNDSDAIFKQLNNSREVLTDSTKRNSYDDWYVGYYKRYIVTQQIIEKQKKKRNKLEQSEINEKLREEEILRNRHNKEARERAERERKKKAAEEEARRKKQEEIQRRQEQERLRKERERLEQERQKKIREKEQRERDVLQRRQQQEREKAEARLRQKVKEEMQREVEEERTRYEQRPKFKFQRNRSARREELLKEARKKRLQRENRMNIDDEKSSESENNIFSDLPKSQYYKLLSDLKYKSDEQVRKHDKLVKESAIYAKKAHIIEKSAEEAFRRAKRKYEDDLERSKLHSMKSTEISEVCNDLMNDILITKASYDDVKKNYEEAYGILDENFPSNENLSTPSPLAPEPQARSETSTPEIQSEPQATKQDEGPKEEQAPQASTPQFSFSSSKFSFSAPSSSSIPFSAQRPSNTNGSFTFSPYFTTFKASDNTTNSENQFSANDGKSNFSSSLQDLQDAWW